MSKKILTGKVISNKMVGTVNVLVESVKSHPIYGKKVKTIKKYLAHATQDLVEGSLVEISECRPYSKNVHFEVTKVLES